MSQLNRVSLLVLRSPLVWGGLSALGFYAGLDGLARANSPLAAIGQRYFADHWVLYVETVSFFVGVAALVLRALDYAGQAAHLPQVALPADNVSSPPTPDPVVEADAVLAGLKSWPRERQHGFLPRRLNEALASVRRNRTADKLDDELKYLGELDAARAYASHALVRIIIWAIPILGFLGTVIGITIAIAGISPEALEASLPEVTGGLGVAFDTTAIALGFSMVLMFGQFALDKQEGRLLSAVDQHASLLLTGRFSLGPRDADPAVAAVRRMSEALLQATGRLVERQAEIWQHTLAASETRYQEVVATGREQLESSLGAGLNEGLAAFGQSLAAAARDSEHRNHQQWSQLAQVLGEQARAVADQQAELARQGDLLLQVVQATAQIARLEETLNGNLAAVAGAQHLQETLLNLSGAVHLLNARLGQIPTLSPHVGLQDTSFSGRAA